VKLDHVILLNVLSGAIILLIVAGLRQIGIEPGTPASYLLSIPPAGFIAVVLAWPIARRFGMSPLMIFSGPCPNCSRRRLGWWIVATEVDRLHLRCGQCGTEVDLWLTRPPSTQLIATTRPAYRLRWPAFLGVWRRTGQ
jgi:hypothetical protein